MSRRHAYGGLPQIPDGYITANAANNSGNVYIIMWIDKT
jgi:hypothetical protein